MEFDKILKDYSDTKPELLYQDARDILLDISNSWNVDNGRGLVLFGGSGSGKTRIACLVISELLKSSRGITFIGLNPTEFSSYSSKSFMKGEELEWIERLCRSRILFLDDVGQSKITQRVGEVLFRVVENRMRAKKPLIITTNFVGESLVSRFEDEQTGIPMLRRLREWCDIKLLK